MERNLRLVEMDSNRCCSRPSSSLVGESFPELPRELRCACAFESRSNVRDLLAVKSFISSSHESRIGAECRGGSS
eukprot:640764-Amorphochlora_amoeboformis.AAC.1